MFLKCVHCDNRYQINRGICPSCGKTGGFSQDPSLKTIKGRNYHLEEILTHEDSGNTYQIKELQLNGLVVKGKRVPPLFIDKTIYISNDNINEYSKGE